ncbi:hypothetical protein N7486_011437 [Penicillium sp. IBT 16267x]|nr:hypothetical protein N7486_011437 [Penicillium sp. IBT 16267x]
MPAASMPDASMPDAPLPPGPLRPVALDSLPALPPSTVDELLFLEKEDPDYMHFSDEEYN